jgi:histone H3/H4
MDQSYAKGLSKQAILKACTALGIKQAKDESIDIISDIIKQFVETVAQRSKDYAENGGRSCVSITDIINTLETVV